MKNKQNVYIHMKDKPETPKVGVGVIIFNNNNKILLGKRKGSHGAGLWGLPGGHIELGEDFHDTCVRETDEETGLVISPKDLEPVGFTNDDFRDEGLHYVTLFFRTKLKGKQVPVNKEPSKCEELKWFGLDNRLPLLPENMSECVKKILKQLEN